MEIGTGWGGFALHAARKYGCQVTTTTISKEQYRFAVKLVEEQGLADRIRVLNDDYRDLQGSFDKLVSIEMIEAVGEQYFDEFFSKCSSLLRDHGMAAIQMITIPDQHYERHLRTVDFIKRYIFPGSTIPSLTAVLQSVRDSTNLRLRDLHDLTPHYAKTLALWRDNFCANWDKIRCQGFSDTFMRMWYYYLCYCEASFQERYNGDVQVLFSKPRAGLPSHQRRLRG